MATDQILYKELMNYFGGKNGSGTYQFIINHIPPHRTYIEPFLGSGAIMRFKKPAHLNIGIDVDAKAIVNFKREIRNTPLTTYYPNSTKILFDEGVNFLKNYDHNSETVIYCDPPYPLSSRKSNKKVYRHEFTDQQHRELIDVIANCGSKVLISTYPNPLYEHSLNHWDRIEFKNKTRKGMATEWLFMNFEKPKKLHDFSFLGKDFTERQRIKRKISNRIRLLEELPELERNAIVYAITEKYSL